MTAANLDHGEASQMRPNGLPELRDLPIKFKRRAATLGFEKFVGKKSDRLTYGWAKVRDDKSISKKTR